MIESKEIISVDEWTVDELHSDGEPSGEEESWYVLRYILREGEREERISLSFDEVKASGGLIHLYRRGQYQVTFSGTISGGNTYRDDSSVPEEIVETLQEIGPW